MLGKQTNQSKRTNLHVIWGYGCCFALAMEAWKSEDSLGYELKPCDDLEI